MGQGVSYFVVQRGTGRDSVLNILNSLYLHMNPAFGHLGIYRSGEVSSLHQGWVIATIRVGLGSIRDVF